MKLNIITPCTRPFNLKEIAKSINIPRENYRWIVIFDMDDIPFDIPDECETYQYRNKDSIVGNSQRNLALSIISEGWVYFNDDDTTIHPALWDNIKSYEDADFITFQQANKDGTLRLNGKTVEVNHIDSHNFIASRKLIGNTKWVLDKYEADGIFANEVWKKSTSYLYIPKVLSIYNSLR